MNLADLSVIRLAGVEAVEALEMWGRWQRQGGQQGRAQGVEGRFRRCRCEHCYELEDPCDACRSVAGSAVPVNEAMAMAIESAITYGSMHTSLGGGRRRITDGCTLKEQALLLAHYRGIRAADGGYRSSHPRVVCRKLGIPFPEYDRLVARVTMAVWNRAKKRF